MKNPFGIAIVSYHECELAIWFCKATVQIVDHVTYLDQNQFVKENTLTHICESNSAHDDQRTDHEALRPCFKNQECRSSGLGLLSYCVGHCDDYSFETRR